MPERDDQPDRAFDVDGLPESPGAARIEPLEERPEVAAAIEDDRTVPGLPVAERAIEDPDMPRFQAPDD